MMSDKLWKKIESPNLPKYIEETDFCIYARDYISGKNYNYCETNQLISNFKKSGLKKDKKNEWMYRNRAIEQFKLEIQQLFKQLFKKPDSKNKLKIITAIPSSKKKNEPEYNNRFEDLFNKLRKSDSSLIEAWPVEIKKTIQASHRGGERNPEYIKENYVWKGFKKRLPKILFVFDDIITTGAHFRAMSDFLRDNKYKGHIIGIIWARAKEDDTEWLKMMLNP